MIVAESLSKYYGQRRALDDVSFRIGRGEVVGFLGPNGAGKTTLLKLLTGQSKPNLGGVQIYGHDAWLAKAKAHVGFCPYGDATWDELSGRKLVAVTAGLHGFTGDEAKRRTEAVLELSLIHISEPTRPY